MTYVMEAHEVINKVLKWRLEQEIYKKPTSAFLLPASSKIHFGIYI